MLRSVDDYYGGTMITSDQIESLRQSAQQIADAKTDELHAARQRVAVEAEAIAQLVAAVSPALPHVAEVIRVTVAPNVQRPIAAVNGGGGVALPAGPNARRGVRVLGNDFEAPTTPIYSWPEVRAVYLTDYGSLLEVVRTAPDKPDDQAADWREREHPRCVVFTNILTPEAAATQYPGAAVEIAKALNRYMAAVGAR